MATPTPKGGKMSPSADRINTPDALNVSEVLSAAFEIERKKQELVGRATSHMSDCSHHRGGECCCPANLHQGFKELERITAGGHVVIRVDDGRTMTKVVPDPHSSSAPPRRVDFFEPPRWICTSCGWGGRMVGLAGHACDPALLAFAAKPVPLHLSVTPEARARGDFRLTIWRDPEGTYHLGEMVVTGGRVVEEVEVAADPFYPAIEGAMSDRLLDGFQS